MRILHYSLGFPPYRTGGLTKFCMDLMNQQMQIGHEVALMWPGQMKLFKKETVVRQRKSQNGIGSFEIINPLPVPYDEGIIDIPEFTARCDKVVFVNFLRNNRPDIIHVHTLMGLHKEFMEAAKERGIKTVFSIHDFFPICPKVTMFREGNVCSSAKSCEKCPLCNLTALSMKKIFLLQTPLYCSLKDSRIMKSLRQKHRGQYLCGEAVAAKDNRITRNTAVDYQELRAYYGSIIALFDKVHANSTVTSDVFSKYFEYVDIEVLQITHSDIKDNRWRKEFLPDKLRLAYLGPGRESKGFFLLKAALDELWLENKRAEKVDDRSDGYRDFELNIYFKPQEMSPYMKVHGRYTYDQLENIFHTTDVLVAPSIGYETFGYTVLEALSYGIPVIVNDHVGAKDIIPKGCGILIEDIDKEKLRDAIGGLSPAYLETMNRNILEKVEIMTIERMTERIMSCCY